MPDSQPDDSDLRERVDTLEALVSDQQQTIQQLMPSRRSVLKGAATFGAGAAAVAATSGSASAQSTDYTGQIGTDVDPHLFVGNLRGGLDGNLDAYGND